MDVYIPDQSGINSLGGFSYQIKVFVLYMLSMEENMQAEFETIEDVSIKSLSAEMIDDIEDNLRNLIISNEKYKVIQVKRTSITPDVAQRVLLNWILLEISNKNVTNYILYTDKKYKNKDNIFDISADDLYLKVLGSKKNKTATISKIKELYRKDKDGFINIYNMIKAKYTFIDEEKIDEEIDEKCKLLFKRGGVKTVVYYNRIKELLMHITYQILKKIGEKKPYIISYEEMIACAEDICSRFTNEVMYPNYSEFKKLNKINFSDLKVYNSREYKQLKACELEQKTIERNLQYENYYKNMTYQYLELNKTGTIENIEETTFDNFEDIKFELQCNGDDQPQRRLMEIKKKSNTYVVNEQIKYGSEIYLTRDEEKERQISWKDEENEKS